MSDDNELESKDLRQQAGRWLQARRERMGLSQRQLAKLIGVKYYTFISQVESGRARIPPERYIDWAKALGFPARDFVREIMRYYEPIAFKILFEQSDEDRPMSISLPEVPRAPAELVELHDWQRPMSELQYLLTKIFIENNTLKRLLELGGRTV